MAEVKVTKDLDNNTLTIEYIVDAPKEKVWRAYTDKDWFEKWWGPEGWETTVKEFDFRVGGKIHYCMKCVDKNQGKWYGQEAWALMEVESIDEPNKITMQDYFSDAEGNINSELPAQKFVVEFIEKDGKTRLVSRSITESAEKLEELVKMGMVEGFSSQLNRLDELVKE